MTENAYYPVFLLAALALVALLERPSALNHAYAAVIDKKFLSRHTLWHARGMARFARKHPGALFRAKGGERT